MSHYDFSSTLFQKGTAFFPGSSLTGNGLLVSDGDIWLRQRRLCNPAFRKSIVDTYAQVANCYCFLVVYSHHTYKMFKNTRKHLKHAKLQI
jgi:cytochrome P450